MGGQKDERRSLLEKQGGLGVYTNNHEYYGTTPANGAAEPPAYNTLVEDDVSMCCLPCCRPKNNFVPAEKEPHIPTDHCHRKRREGLNKKATRKLIIATCLCFFFMTCEGVGGYISNSIAVMTDAAHLCTDLFAFFVSLTALVLASRKPGPTMTFGWKRVEVIGAIISVLMIWVITAILVDLAVGRLLNPDYVIEAPVMVGTSALGIIINIIMGCTLTQDTAGNDEDVNINVRAAFIHVLGDLVQSIGVFTAAIIIYIRPDWIIADPICTFIFSVIVMCTTFGVLKDAIRVLVAARPSEVDVPEVSAALSALPGVMSQHGLRVWALSMDSNAIMVHLAIDESADPASTVDLATNVLRNGFHFYEICVQVEPHRAGMAECDLCAADQLVTGPPQQLTTV